MSTYRLFCLKCHLDLKGYDKEEQIYQTWGEEASKHLFPTYRVGLDGYGCECWNLQEGSTPGFENDNDLCDWVMIDLETGIDFFSGEKIICDCDKCQVRLLCLQEPRRCPKEEDYGN